MGKILEQSIKTGDSNLLPSLYKNIASFTPGILVVLDASTLDIVFGNEEFERRFGGFNDAGKIKSFAAMLGTVQQKQFKTQVSQLEKNALGRDHYEVYRLKTKNGLKQLFYAYLSFVGAKSDTQEYLSVLLLPEISNKEIPFISSDSRELFLDLFSKINFGTFEWNVEDDKLFCSDGIYNIYELDKTISDIDHELAHQFIHPEDKDRVKAVLKYVVESGENFDIEMRIITARQNIKSIHVLGGMVVDSDGTPVKLIGSVRDITEQRTVEQNLQRHVEELFRSNKELEQFAYVASHDLQEPLRKITTFCDRLSEKYQGELSGDGALYIDRIIASAENMRILINNLLQFSRVARENEPFTKTDLTFLLKEVKNDLELPIEETKTNINVGELPVVEASFSQMKQLFTNVINNSIKFRRTDQTPIINISSVALKKDEILNFALDIKKAYYKIEVTDNGIGFEKEYADRIFQIFQRLHGKADYPGSGIGLAICKKIVENHKGLIFATGKEGEGSVFTIILPERQ
jgi:signal transduction histidine kinase